MATKIRVTDPNIRAKHKLKERVELPYVCACGERFRTYNDWREHGIEEATIDGPWNAEAKEK